MVTTMTTITLTVLQDHVVHYDETTRKNSIMMMMMMMMRMRMRHDDEM